MVKRELEDSEEEGGRPTMSLEVPTGWRDHSACGSDYASYCDLCWTGA